MVEEIDGVEGGGGETTTQHAPRRSLWRFSRDGRFGIFIGLVAAFVVIALVSFVGGIVKAASTGTPATSSDVNVAVVRGGISTYVAPIFALTLGSKLPATLDPSGNYCLSASSKPLGPTARLTNGFYVVTITNTHAPSSDGVLYVDDIRAKVESRTPAPKTVVQFSCVTDSATPAEGWLQANLDNSPRLWTTSASLGGIDKSLGSPTFEVPAGASVSFVTTFSAKKFNYRLALQAEFKNSEGAEWLSTLTAPSQSISVGGTGVPQMQIVPRDESKGLYTCTDPVEFKFDGTCGLKAVPTSEDISELRNGNYQGIVGSK